MSQDKDNPVLAEKPVVAVWCPICGTIIEMPPSGCKDFVWVEDVCELCKRAWDY